jgi:tetratricopeptide (TPR) repeat protein
MKIAVAVAVLVVFAGLAPAQRHKLEINAETPGGKLLQQIGEESDDSKKLALLEDFAAKNPKHQAIAWVYSQMVPAYTKAAQYDKALDAGDKLLAIDPEDIEGAHAVLKAAEAKKDPDQVIKWAGKTSAVARKIAQSPKPASEDDVDVWKREVDFAKQVDVYTEYSLYALALQSPDPRAKLKLVDALEAQSPASQYAPQLVTPRFQAYLQAGEAQKAIALAEKVVEKDQSNEDMLLAVADGYHAAKKDPAKVIELAQKAVQAANAKPKPEGVSEADWSKRKTLISGRAEYLAGVTYGEQSRWAEADRALRAALPAIKDNRPLTAEALFYLGLANYRLGEKGQPERIRDAVRFNEQCAAIPGPLQAQARTNLKVIRSQYRNIR